MEMAISREMSSKSFDDAVDEFFELLDLCIGDKTFFVGRTTDSDFTVLKISDKNHSVKEGLTLDLKDSL